MARLAITGGKGKIARALKRRLDHEITTIDLPETDVRDYESLLQVLPGHDAVLHLAWDNVTETYQSGKINPENALMVHNVYNAAIEANVPRVIIASSVHADNAYAFRGIGLMSPEKTPWPDSPYGASKVFTESLGRYYSTSGLEVICIRFGGCNRDDIPPVHDEYEKRVWLSHDDCARLIDACLTADHVPNNFAIIYGVSNNAGRIHDVSNPFGWIPEDDAER